MFYHGVVFAHAAIGGLFCLRGVLHLHKSMVYVPPLCAFRARRASNISGYLSFGLLLASDSSCDPRWLGNLFDVATCAWMGIACCWALHIALDPARFWGFSALADFMNYWKTVGTEFGYTENPLVPYKRKNKKDLRQLSMNLLTSRWQHREFPLNM